MELGMLYSGQVASGALPTECTSYPTVSGQTFQSMKIWIKSQTTRVQLRPGLKYTCFRRNIYQHVAILSDHGDGTWTVAWLGFMIGNSRPFGGRTYESIRKERLPTSELMPDLNKYFHSEGFVIPSQDDYDRVMEAAGMVNPNGT